MVEQRKESRTARPLKVKYKSASVDDFVQQQGTDVSRTGVFIKTKSPLEAGELLKLELQLADSSAVIAGVGRVAWRRASSTDASRPAGMGIKFIKLEAASQAIVERIVSERGETPSRFDQNEGAELARPSLEPPAPSLPSPPRAPTPVPSQQPAAPVTAKPAAPTAPPATPPATPRAVSPLSASIPFASVPSAPVKTSMPATAASQSTRIGPTKATIPSGLFAQTPIAKKDAAPIEEQQRTSFFPPAPAPAPAAPSSSGRTTGSTSAATQVPRSSAGSVSSPLNRTSSARTSAPGPKGVFGSPAAPSPLASSASGTLRPAKEISGLSTNALFSSRDDESATTAPISRGSRRPPSTPLPMDEKPTTRPPPMEAPPPAELPPQPRTPEPRTPEDGMFATLEPLGADSEGSGSFAQPSPLLRSSRPSARVSQPNASPEAEVDALFADLAGEPPPFDDEEEAPTGDMERPPPAGAIFSPGSTHPSAAPELDELLGSDNDDDFGEADLVGSASIRPMLSDEGEPRTSQIPRLGESQRPEVQPEASARGSNSKLIAIVLAVLVVIGIGVAFFASKPDAAPTTSTPAQPNAPTEAPAVPTTPVAPDPTSATAEPSAAAQAAAPPAAADGPSTRVNVTALPRGADVKVDGVTAGVAPTNIDLPIGREVTVSVSAQGHASINKQIKASEGMEPLRFKLDPLPYVLVVITSPPQAEISYGGKTGVSPAPLELGHLTGDVEVSIAKDGYRKMTRPVRLDAFEERDSVLRAEIEVTLSPMPGTVAPKAAPAAAPPATSRRSSSSRRGNSTEAAPAPPEPEAVAKEPEPGDDLAPASKPVAKEPEPGDDIEPEKPATPKAPPLPPPLPELPELP
jgi:uncharacterized protein (TIGR02266 family)